jgi:hypothetical protein
VIICEIECGQSWYVCVRARYAREPQLRAFWHFVLAERVVMLGLMMMMRRGVVVSRRQMMMLLRRMLRRLGHLSYLL